MAPNASTAPVAPTSFLTGFNPDAPMPPVAAGTVLSNGQLFGSHLFQNLKKFGAGLNQSGLLQLGEKLFVDAANGFLPNPIDRSILNGIVGMISGKTAGSGTAETADTTTTIGGTASSGGSNVLRITVTVELPPGAKAQVSQSGAQQSGEASKSSKTAGNPVGNSEAPTQAKPTEDSKPTEKKAPSGPAANP